MTYLPLIPDADHNEIRRLQKKNTTWLAGKKKGVLRYREPFESIAEIRAEYLDLSGDVVRIGKKDELTIKQHKKVYQVLKEFMPWRKGPFEIFGIPIDAEWRSEYKWKHVIPELPDLKDKIIADIGCNNGYYMFRMAPSAPKMVIGFEPYLLHYFTFNTLNSFARQKNLYLELMGVEQIPLYSNSFDLVFLMGIIYHRISPIEMLKNINKAMTRQGTIIVESQAIQGEEPVALFPEKTYAKAPGVYFVPTASCLCNWLARTGFKDIKLFHSHPMNSQLQRKTEWMDFESYSDFIDPLNSDLTIEGYPAPIRVFIKATKR
jgi:tRNA (mo5U34)-methyltransferase